MEKAKILQVFFKAAQNDNRINRSHLALYSSLFNYWCIQGLQNPLSAFGAEIMSFAKISSTATYHRLVKELDEYGYLNYKPSFYKCRRSEIDLTPYGGKERKHTHVIPLKIMK